MLNVIHQNETQKLSVSNYFIANTKDNVPCIFAIIDQNTVGLASYDKIEDAKEVFNAMVIAEKHNLFCKLPKDNAEDLKAFLKIWFDIEAKDQ